MQVPTVKEMNELLYEFHVNKFNCNYKVVQDSFKKAKIDFYGINEIIEEYVSNCPICAQSSKTLNRQDPIKSIDILGLNMRYEFDLTYLNNDLAEVFGIKMLLSIIDAFSRKAMIYPENEKNEKIY